MNTLLKSVPGNLGISRTSRKGGQNLSLLIVLIVAVGLTVTTEQFLSAENAQNLVVQVTPLLLVALGQTIVVLTGGLDVSVGALIGLVAAAITLPIDPAVGILLVLGIAIVVGTINGSAIAFLDIHPIIATLSTSTIITGIALLIRPTPGGDVPGWLALSVGSGFAGVPSELAWCVLAMAAALYLLGRTRFGLYVFAIGGSAENARLAGINVTRVTIMSYITCSLFAASAGLFLAARISSGDALIGLPFTLASITAVALGGTQFTGGLGGAKGTLLGCLLLAILSNGMNLLNVSPFLQSIVSGLLLLLAVGFTRRKTIGI
ncbi:ABC transporter permease [Phaeobacter sp. LSS9]|uniref:ABC transporter permease n=1 Tax=unclassified Phaeobacter TaxID=2621772 RepID=UPI000E4AE5EC|nr:ABC transporter permease [Phaeobacter sp. LSS9]AXT36250.1 ABC transporter permease [Phaeobacter sp. LSS9]